MERIDAKIQSQEQALDAKKVSINNLFGTFWFTVPDYQRQYVWGDSQINELMDDLIDAQQENPNKEYFLGSMVLQKRQEEKGNITFTSYDILDGQQRITTLLLLMAVLRDLKIDELTSQNTQNAIFQGYDPYQNKPNRIRVKFSKRGDVIDFVNEYIVKEDGTKQKRKLQTAQNTPDLSIAAMASNILKIKKRLEEMDSSMVRAFAIFLFNKVNIIYISADNLDDAFKLFTILNSRGLPLTTSDILKSINIGEVNDEERARYTEGWERIESIYGKEKFDDFLGYVRTIVLMERRRESLLKEYEKIYRQGKLKKGKDTLVFIWKCKKSYNEYLQKSSYTNEDTFKLSNLLTIMKLELKSDDWVPPFLAYCNKFQNRHLLAFVERLESKFLADWILKVSPAQKRKNLYAILRAIKENKEPENVLSDRELFAYDKDLLEERLNQSMYKSVYCRYLLFKIEYLLMDPSQSFPSFKYASVEHVLPQNPREGSQWKRDFNEIDRRNFTNILANLVLLSRRKNSKLNNKDFVDKKESYFNSSINIFPNVNQVMHSEEWTPHVLVRRQNKLIELLMAGFK